MNELFPRFYLTLYAGRELHSASSASPAFAMRYGIGSVSFHFFIIRQRFGRELSLQLVFNILEILESFGLSARLLLIFFSQLVILLLSGNHLREKLLQLLICTRYFAVQLQHLIFQLGAALRDSLYIF